MSADAWTFLSNHGYVLVCLARDPDVRMRVVGGYVEKEKLGRRNRYRVVRSSHLRRELEADVSLGRFVDLVLTGGRRAD